MLRSFEVGWIPVVAKLVNAHGNECTSNRGMWVQIPPTGPPQDGEG